MGYKIFFIFSFRIKKIPCSCTFFYKKTFPNFKVSQLFSLISMIIFGSDLFKLLFQIQTQLKFIDSRKTHAQGPKFIYIDGFYRSKNVFNGFTTLLAFKFNPPISTLPPKKIKSFQDIPSIRK